MFAPSSLGTYAGISTCRGLGLTARPGLDGADTEGGNPVNGGSDGE